MQNEEIINRLIEVELPEPDSFLKIRETLGRIGIASKKANMLHSWLTEHCLSSMILVCSPRR